MAINAIGVSQPRYCEAPGFALQNGLKETPAQAAGRRYEEKVLPYLNQWGIKNRYTISAKPWIKYFNAQEKLVWCQPDWVGIGIDTDNIIVIEVKIRHTRDAFFQLRRYKDVIDVLHPGHHISLIEVCKNFDMSEFKTTLLTEIKPHNLPHAAVVFDPAQWTAQYN